MKNYRSKFPVALMSKVLGVSKSGFYKWLNNSEIRKEQQALLATQIKTAYESSFNTYGSPRITKLLQSKNIKCSKSTVARKMKSLRISARTRRKYVITTDSDHNYKVAENLLNRQFDVKVPNTVWVSDITYVRVKHDWMYLTTMIDLADRMVVGWSLSHDMTTQNTVVAAFKKAVARRQINTKSKLLIHSDRGIQYASKQFRSLLAKYKCTQSMSRKGNCWDNAPAESFFKTIKVEALYRHKFDNENQLRTVIFRYIDGWYNTLRIHSTLGGLSPLQTFILKSNKSAA